MKGHSFDCLVSHPYVGSVWLSRVRLIDGYVVGEAWDDDMCGSPYYPDDYPGEPCTMNFPISCVRKTIHYTPPEGA